MSLKENTTRRIGSALVFLLSVFIGNSVHAATISAPSDFIITQGQTGAVPISVTDAGSGIVGVDVTLQFDSSVIEVFGSGSSLYSSRGLLRTAGSWSRTSFRFPARPKSCVSPPHPAVLRCPLRARRLCSRLHFSPLRQRARPLHRSCYHWPIERVGCFHHQRVGQTGR